MLTAGLADPPRGLLAGLPKCVPLLDHPAATGIRLDPRHLPRLAAHRLQECRIQTIHVDVVTLVRARADPLELHFCLGHLGTWLAEAEMQFVPALIRSNCISASASQVPRWATTSRTVQSGSA